MIAFDAEGYSVFFKRLTGFDPFPYQVEVAQALCGGNNAVVRAPTGAGKTWAVLVPFLSSYWSYRPARLIYALPLRTLAQGVYRDACQAAQTLGFPTEDQARGQGQEVERPFVTIQTGEQPDDPFFDRGTIIVTTYDQLLSGLLNGPYGLSGRLHNINSGAIAGSLVVFDEFHLMEPRRAFVTAVAGLHLFRNICQSVWMTATATRPLECVLQDALGTIPIPAGPVELGELLASLPSVTEVHRDLVVEREPISPESVLRSHRGRSLVLLNTVGRAQALFEALRGIVDSEKLGIPLLLLHSRFFKEDRRTKEQALRDLFGKTTKGQGILVATQVVEAGLDISGDQLHTELCPMNALVQRAGRCARFAGQSGTVHVYPLPPEERTWLPYGDLAHEDGELARTRDLLGRVGPCTFDPRAAAAWIEETHGPADELALRGGWRGRLKECLSRIEQNAILRTPRRVADLIRGEDTDSLRVIIANEATRPETPGGREAIRLSRWSIYRLYREMGGDIGWVWDGSDEEPWRPVETPEDLATTYVVCLRPCVAAYDHEVGLRLGISGTAESPARQELKRPGYAPLKVESWAEHSRRVFDEARRRFKREHWEVGLLAKGFERQYGLSPQGLLEAVRVCAFLHDLGKLQDAWQRWAAAAQRAKDPGYSGQVPLAHTDFDPESPEDRARERSLGVWRPPHAAASAYYGAGLLAALLPSVPEGQRTAVASACAGAILAHHGGWLPAELDMGITPLCNGWEGPLAEVLGPISEVNALKALVVHKDKRGATDRLLTLTTGPEAMGNWWPLVAYLTRSLRLSDQRATAAGGSSE